MDRVLAGRYQLESKIGSGGMGTVWRARDAVLDRLVAVKVLHEGLASDAAFAERFRREARAAASLAHPNVCAVYDTGEADVPFIVMEYVEGESLHNMLRRRGPLPIEDTARIARSVLAALAHAHSRGLIHRDMKPANVLFDATSGQAKVVDFGIAKGLEDTGGLTRTSGLIGTAAYLSPEQVSGREATHASDLYAVGCLLYCCLAGEPPFGGPTAIAIAMRHLRDPVPPLRARRPDLPPDLDAVVLRSLEKEPARRFSSAQEMDAAVAATGLDGRPATMPVVAEVVPAAATMAMHEHPVGAPLGTEMLQHRVPARTNTGWLAALTAFLVVAAVAAVAVLYLQSRQPPLVEATPLPLATPTPTVETPSPQPSPTPTATPEQDEEDEEDEETEPPGGLVGRLPGFGN